MTKRDIQRFLSGEILSHEWLFKHRGLLLLIAGWIFVYITMGYVSERQQRHQSELNVQLQEAEFTLMTLQAEQTNLTRQSSVAEELNRRGSSLKENVKAVKRIK